jgi:hypothetical protein
MRLPLKKIIAYVTRGWDKEPGGAPHPRLKIIPPIFIELLGYALIISLIYWALSWLYNLLFTL